MNNRTAVAASAAMVAVAAIATGSVFLGQQAGATPGVPEPAPHSEVVVDYVSADGEIVSIDTSSAASTTADVSSSAPAGEATSYEEHEYEDEEHEEGEYEEHEGDEYEDDEEHEDEEECEDDD